MMEINKKKITSYAKLFRLLVGFGCLLLFSSAFCFATLEPGQLYIDCKVSLKMTNSFQTINTPDELIQRAICQSYILGAYESNLWVELRPNISLTDVTQAFVTFIDKHPKLKRSNINERVKNYSWTYSAQVVIAALRESNMITCLSNSGFFESCSKVDQEFQRKNRHQTPLKK